MALFELTEGDWFIDNSEIGFCLSTGYCAGLSYTESNGTNTHTVRYQDELTQEFPAPEDISEWANT